MCLMPYQKEQQTNIKNIIFLILLISFAYSCKPKHETKNNRKIISVSIVPQKYFIDKIAGKDFEVNVMVPPGSSPETYEPNAEQMRHIAKSKLYFKIGHLDFEKAWLSNVAESNQEMKIIDLSSGIKLIEGGDFSYKHGDHHHFGTDPHIWSSPKQVRIMANTMFHALVAEYPEYKTIFEQNLEAFLVEIDELDEFINNKLKNLSNRKFMIFHPALGYLARDYNLEQLSIEIEGKSPSPLEMKKTIQVARENNIRMIFVQKQFELERALAIAKEISGEAVYIDPLEYDWNKQMTEIANKLYEVLSSKSN